MIFFMARLNTPPCVRWHSSTNTKRSPLALNPAGSCSATCSMYCATVGFPASFRSMADRFFPCPFFPRTRPNLLTIVVTSQSRLPSSVRIRSAPLVTRRGFSPASRNAFAICRSSSSRSVMMTTRASFRFSRIHCASHTIISDFPDPCVCQMMPLSFRDTRGFAASSANTWLGRMIFLTPPSNTMESCTSPRNRPGSNIWSSDRSSSFFTSSGVKNPGSQGVPQGSSHATQYFGTVSVVPYRTPSDSLPATSSCVVEKNPGISPSCWFRQFCRMPSATDTVAFFSSMTANRMPFTYKHTSGCR